MSKITLPLSEIVVAPNRMRREMGDIERLADSISRLGLIQPIVIDKDKHLIAGERRYRAHQFLKRDTIEVVFKDDKDIPEDIRKEMEFEENYRRKTMTWQEEAIGVLDIYRTKKRKGSLEGFKENWHETVAEMFGLAIGTVNYILLVGKRLEAEKSLPDDKRRLWKFSSVNEAYRLGILAEEEDKHNQLLAAQGRASINSSREEKETEKLINEVATAAAIPNALAEAKAKYEANPLNKVPFEQYWAEKEATAKERQNTLYIYNKLLKGDCRATLVGSEFEGRFDAIITDPPYAIDMDNLNQNNQNGGLVQLDRVVEAHQVDENLKLLNDFFPLAFKVTKPKAFVALFCDPMVWQYLYDHAIAAGFRVQRWPVIWRKVNQSCMNNMSGYNTTKDYEIVMLCSKPGTTLYKKLNTSIIDGSNVETVKLTGHPFAKPFEVTQHLIDCLTIEGQEVLEPFSGGGSIILNLIKNKRKWVACEKEEHWYNALVERVKQHYLKLSPNFVFK